MTGTARPRRTARRGRIGTAPFLLLVVVGVLGVVLLATGLRDDEPAAADREPGARSSAAPGGDDPGLARRTSGDPLAIGAPDAPVAVIEYADFRCPFCAKYARETLPRLIEKYVDTGLVRYEFRDVPLFGKHSRNAAIAGRAAAAQGRFWEFFDALYGAAPDSGHPPMPRSRLLELAREAGVADLARFERDLDAADHGRAVDTDLAEAQQIGVNSVPFFVIDDVALSGAQPLEVFEQVIDEQLAEHDLAPKS